MKVPLPDLPLYVKNAMLGKLDQYLNCMILQAFLHGLYTGMVAVALWTIFSSSKRLRSTFLRTVIVILFVLLTTAFTTSLAFGRRAFIEHSDNYYSVFTALLNDGPWWRANYLVNGISGGISTLLIDTTIIWRCWTLWGRQWRVIFAPMICAVAGTIMKAMQISSAYDDFTNDSSGSSHLDPKINWPLIYILLTLVTTLVCTILIVYRILRHAPGMSASRKIVEMLIESSAMYSISLIIYLVLVSKNSESGYYTDIIAAYVKAIAPTLLVGRVSAHANAASRREKMVAMWENHPPLVGCFREEGTDNSHSPYGGHQTVSGSSMSNETV